MSRFTAHWLSMNTNKLSMNITHCNGYDVTQTHKCWKQARVYKVSWVKLTCSLTSPWFSSYRRKFLEDLVLTGSTNAFLVFLMCLYYSNRLLFFFPFFFIRILYVIVCVCVVLWTRFLSQLQFGIEVSDSSLHIYTLLYTMVYKSSQ